MKEEMERVLKVGENIILSRLARLRVGKSKNISVTSTKYLHVHGSSCCCQQTSFIEWDIPNIPWFVLGMNETD